MFGHGDNPDGKARGVLSAVDALLAEGERRRAASVVRGLGRGVDVGRAVDWLLVATDRRVLLLTLPPTAGGVPRLVSSYPHGEVLVIDAHLSGPAPTLVVRFPDSADTVDTVDAVDAVVAWFHPPAAWREETRRLVDELGRVVPYPEEDAADDSGSGGGAGGTRDRRAADDFRS